jgi:hypothetical protein
MPTADIGAIDFGEGFDAGRAGDHVGALDQAIVRPEVDPLPALVIDGQEGNIDGAGFDGIGSQARIGHDHELRRNAELLREFVDEIDGDATRASVRVLYGKERRKRRRVDDAGAELAGGNEFFHGGGLVVGPGDIGPAGEQHRCQQQRDRLEALHRGLLLMGAPVGSPQRLHRCVPAEVAFACLRRARMLPSRCMPLVRHRHPLCISGGECFHPCRDGRPADRGRSCRSPTSGRRSWRRSLAFRSPVTARAQKTAGPPWAALQRDASPCYCSALESDVFSLLKRQGENHKSVSSFPLPPKECTDGPAPQID